MSIESLTATLEPIKEVVPESLWPENFFTSTQEDGTSLLDRIYLAEHSLVEASDGILIRATLLIEGEIAIGIPDITDFAFIVGGGVEGFTMITLEILLGSESYLKIDNFRLGIRFPPQVLKPAPETDGSPTKQYSEIYTEISILIDTDFNLHFLEFPELNLEKSFVAGTDIAIEVFDMILDFSRTSSPSEILDAGFNESFLGIFIGLGKLIIPYASTGEGTNKQPLTLSLEKAIIGTGGFSGEVAAEWEVEVEGENFIAERCGMLCNLFSNDFQTSLRRIAIKFENNMLSKEFSIEGALKLPIFKRIVEFKIGLGEDLEFFGQVSGWEGYKILLYGTPPDETHLMLESVSISRQPPNTYELRLKNVDFAIKPGKDGLMKEILPPEGVTATVGDSGDLVIGYSKSKGVYLEGGSLEIAIPLHKTFGPVLLDVLYIGLRSSGATTFLELAATLAAKIGPVGAAVDRMGLELPITPNDSGNFGPVDIGDPQFKFPDGIALGFDGSGVKGGGSIFRKGTQYGGTFDLKLATFGVTALAVIDTEPVFSFIVAVFADLNIQLGAGFTLTKVGGLLGIHRTVSHQTIASGIQSGIMDDLLFPKDVIARAPQVIQNYSNSFPYLRNQFLFGPAVQVGYGTPTLISASLAILFEFPNPFVLTLLGKINVNIPEPQPVVQLNLGILGAIDFTNKNMGLYGSLYNSKLLNFPLSGDMGFAASWGSEKNFIFSIGGFHPRYTPPPNFPPFGAPPLKRLQIAFSSHVSLETYLAITTNTFQVGAHVDARFSGAGAKIHGYLGFDALIQFSPLYYIVDVAAGFSVKYKGRRLASVKFSGELEGPNPHKIKGKAKFKILWWKVKVKVKKTFGSKKAEVIEQNDPWLLLEPELNRNENWNPELPAWADLAVIIKDPSITPDLVHPLGDLRFSQSAVPINYTMNWVITGKPKNYNRFELSSGTPELSESFVQEQFAPAHWTIMNDPTERLTAKSTDLMDSGLSLSSTEVTFDSDSASQKEMKYETKAVNPEGYELPEDDKVFALFKPNNLEASIFQLSGAAYQNVLRNHGNFCYNYSHIPEAASISDENFLIVDENLQPVPVPTLQGEFSQAIANNKLQDYNRTHPEAQNFQVVSAFELEGALI